MFSRLRLEALDSRELPSSPSTVTPPSTYQSSYSLNQNPVITSFTATVGANGITTFAGTVTDDHNLEGCVVTIAGPGVSTYALILANGSFSTTATVYGTAQITVGAIATDADGAHSDTVSTTFTPPAGPGNGGGGQAPPAANQGPTLQNVRVVAGAGGALALTGHGVDNKSLEGCVVTIIGPGVNTFTLVDANGDFATTFTRPSRFGFTIKVQLTDSDGNKSQEVEVAIPPL